jgi:hypothetical protein
VNKLVWAKTIVFDFIWYILKVVYKRNALLIIVVEPLRLNKGKTSENWRRKVTDLRGNL